MPKNSNTDTKPQCVQTDVIGSFPFIKFKENNEYRFGMDFNFFKGIPSDIMFYPISESNNGLITFIGNGYGILKEHKEKLGLSGEYGNGSIYVYASDIPHLLDWCRSNFL
jgi:hypothetical protein